MSTPPKGKFALWPDVAAAVYSAAFVVWLALPGESRATRDLIGALIFLPAELAVVWACWRTGRVWPYDAQTRRAWMLMGAAHLLYLLSATAWSVLIVYSRDLLSSVWADSLSLATYPLLLVALLHFPGVFRDRSSRARYLLDLSLLFVGCLLAAWYFSFLPVAGRATGSERLTSTLIYPAADLVILAVSGMAILGATHPTTRRALAFVFAGRVLRMCASVTYALIRKPGDYHNGDWLDAFWFAAWMFVWIAARLPQRRLASGATDLEREQARTYRSGALPVLSALFAQGLLLWLLRGELHGDAGVVAIATTILTGLIALRQVAELRENSRLREVERRQEARFRSLVQRGSDVVLVVGPRGEIIYRSPSAERLLPREGAEAPRRLADLFEPADAAALEALAGGPSAAPLPARARLEGGGTAHLEFLASDLRRDPALGGVVLTGRDVTERHRLADELHRTQKLRAVGQTAGGIAHDLNNILFALRGNAELLLEDLPQDSPARAEVTEIRRAADRAAAVTRKLLQFSRRELSKRVTVDVNALVAEFEPVLRQFISAGIEVRLDYAKAPAWVVVDRRQLEQVVLELSMNARDAMPGGGILRLRIDRSAAPGEVTLEVEDTGVGMDESIRGRIFEPFFTTKPQGHGTGLGLASAYGIIDGAGGELRVASAQGRGTTFTVVLPRAPAPAEARS